MALSLSLATQICALFIIIAVGYILIKTNLCQIEHSKMLSLIVLYVSTPCAIINAFQIDLTPERVQGFIVSIVAAFAANISFILLANVLSPIFHFNDVEKASVIYSNAGNLIIPLVSIVLGEEMVFYCSGYMLVQTVLLWTHCNFLISGEKNFDIKKILKNINVIAIFVGMLFFFTGIQLPTVIASAVNSMAALIGPLSMFVVGMLLSQMDLKKVILDKRAYLVCFIRLIFMSLIMAVLYIIATHFLYEGAAQVLMISLLAASGPAASTVTQFAQIYDRNAYQASVINALSVILCIVTMPIINMIFTHFTGL
ncbi:MAG: AEC family transporter [Faecalicoccus sp.]|nr:AEC family transporter [Faecalicoccus sp.]